MDINKNIRLILDIATSLLTLMQQMQIKKEPPNTECRNVNTQSMHIPTESIHPTLRKQHGQTSHGQAGQTSTPENTNTMYIQTNKLYLILTSLVILDRSCHLRVVLSSGTYLLLVLRGTSLLYRVTGTTVLVLCNWVLVLGTIVWVQSYWTLVWVLGLVTNKGLSCALC